MTDTPPLDITALLWALEHTYDVNPTNRAAAEAHLKTVRVGCGWSVYAETLRVFVRPWRAESAVCCPDKVVTEWWEREVTALETPRRSTRFFFLFLFFSFLLFCGDRLCSCRCSTTTTTTARRTALRVS